MTCAKLFLFVTKTEKLHWKCENGHMATEKMGRKFDDGIRLKYETYVYKWNLEDGMHLKYQN